MTDKQFPFYKPFSFPKSDGRKPITKTPFEVLIATAYAEAALSQIKQEATQIMTGDYTTRDTSGGKPATIARATTDWLDYLEQARTAYFEAKKQRRERESEG